MALVQSHTLVHILDIITSEIANIRSMKAHFFLPVKFFVPDKWHEE